MDLVIMNGRSMVYGSNDRVTAYAILSTFRPYVAGDWFGEKQDIMAEWPKTLHEMEPDLALRVVQGLWQEEVLGVPKKRFKYHHTAFGPKEYMMMWETHAT